MPRAKWLNELEDKENLEILTRFEERYTKSYYNVVIIRYFLIDKPYTLI
jgi:NifB/MoaA-like Fe-S oxidoreductase